ncbi:class I adenylate-forming enzyme family protein [Sinimarinibacterium flocculans]|uniref:class I adenylate-forming enzyme family protein n=1 Tax=Sinimarinibacterium flocculans TaxID=985250 RepID=UPI00351643B7
MPDQNLWDAFCAVAAREPSRPALLMPGAAIDFAAVRTRAEHYRQHLLGAGVQPGDRVLVLAQNSPETLAAMLGVWGSAGIVAMADAGLRAPQIRHAAETVSPRLCLSTTELPAVELPCPVVRPAQIEASDARRSPSRQSLPTDAASIMFTSGSTGRAKGVVQSHGNILRGSRAVAGYLGLKETDRVLCPVPWAFDYGFVQLHFTLVLGLTHVTVAQANPFAVCAAIQEHRPQLFAGIPSLYTYLLRGVSPLRNTDLSSLRVLTNSGGTIPAPVLQDLVALAPQCRLFLNYGLTETYRTSYLDPERVATHPLSIGRPIPGVDVVILRPDGSRAGTGEVGEIVHRGDYVCLGYWNQPEATARAVRADPLLPPESPDRGRALYTGDLGSIDADGLLYYHGRRDQQLKSMGVRVSPSEVEALLHESGFLLEVAVFGMPHDMLGDEIWAAVVPAGPVDGLQQKLQAHAKQVMSPYMTPRRWLIREALPRTSTGKIDYPALKAEARLAPSAQLSG